MEKGRFLTCETDEGKEFKMWWMIKKHMKLIEKGDI